MQKSKYIFIAICLVALVGVGALFGGYVSVAKAFENGINIYVQQGGILNLFGAENNGSNLGGTTNYDDLELSGDLTVGDDATITDALSAADLTATDDMVVGDDLTVTGSIVNGLETITATGDCRNATNTIVSFVNPLGKEAYIGVGDFVLAGDNGTSTVQITCGTSSSVYLSADPSDYLLDDVEVATSTLGTATTTFRTANNSGTLTKAAGFYDGGTNSQDMMIVGASDYVSCFVVETESGSGGWSGANNMANCTYLATFHELQ